MSDRQLVAASLFSGAGGSSLGVKRAGFRVAYANEFVPAAAEVYRANNPGTIVDDRDIRTVDPEEVLVACGVGVGELDLLEGSPPCSSFSTAGKGAKGWGEVRKYSDVEQRTDDLFPEFVRILRGTKPRAFFAENVPGLARGVAAGFFKEIYRDLDAAGYAVSCREINAQWLGVPQARKRLFFVGVRSDLGRAPMFPTPNTASVSIRKALLGLPEPSAAELAEVDFTRFAIFEEWKKLRGGQSSEKYFQLVRPHPDLPCPTVTATGGNIGAAGVTHPLWPRKFTIPELKRICGFPDDFILTGTFEQQWERLGRSVPPPVAEAVARRIAEVIA